MSDRTAFEGIYERHAAEVFRVALSVLHDAALAEDVTQDVFERFWRTASYDERRGPVDGYLRLMARSRALDLWRRLRAGERVEHRLEQHARAPRPDGDDPEAVLLRATERRTARAAVHRLPRDQRQAVGLVYWGGLSVPQMARAEGLALGTAKSRVRLALGKLAHDPTIAVPQS